MTAKGTPKKPAAPATVLVITLEPDGNGSLLARRGELAHLSQFAYRGMSEIVTAIQQSATALISVEENPPSVDVTPAPPIVDAPVAQTDEDAPSETPEIESSTPVDTPDPLAIPSDPQPKLI